MSSWLRNNRRSSRKYAEIQPKKYRIRDIKAIAHYCFLFFDQFKGSKNGKANSFSHTQGAGYKRPADQGIFGYYNAKCSWTQYSKERKTGAMKRRWWYGFSANEEQEIYWSEITFTGRYKQEQYSYTEVFENEDTGDTYTTHTWYEAYPIYLVKTYGALVESDLNSTDGYSVWDELDGIPVWYVQLDNIEEYEEDNRPTDGDGNKYIPVNGSVTNGYTYSYDYVGEDKNGIITTTNPTEKLKISSKYLISIKETTEINMCGMPLTRNNIYYQTFVTRYPDVSEDDGFHTVDPTYTTSYPKGYLVATNGKVRVPLTSEAKTTPYNVANDFLTIKNGYSTGVAGISGTRPNVDIEPKPAPEVYPDGILLDKDKPTYVCAVDLESLGYYFESTTFSYYHKIDQFSYEVIKVKGFTTNWAINQNHGDQHYANAMSALAPSSFTYIPICAKLTHKLSFYETMTVNYYASNIYMSFWISQKVSGWVRSRGTFFTIVGIIIIVIVTIITVGQLTPYVIAGFAAGASAAAAAEGVAAAIAIGAMITGALMSVIGLLLPSDSGIKKYMLTIGAILMAVAGSYTNTLVKGVAFLNASLVISVGCSLANLVFDIVYDQKNKGLSEQQSSNTNAYNSANTELTNKMNSLTGGASVSATGLASTYSSQIAYGLDSDEVTDLMVSTTYPQDIVYASLDLDLGVFTTITNGTGYSLYNFENLWNKGELA